MSSRTLINLLGENREFTTLIHSRRGLSDELVFENQSLKVVMAYRLGMAPFPPANSGLKPVLEVVLVWRPLDPSIAKQNVYDATVLVKVRKFIEDHLPEVDDFFKKNNAQVSVRRAGQDTERCFGYGVSSELLSAVEKINKAYGE